LKKYREKRSFTRTPEPAGKSGARTTGSFVVQRHSARRLHYDFRLEVAGTLKSWAVPKGPPLADGEKRLAIHVEDHPLEYAKFEGEIPKGNYGAGDVRIWDRGKFETEGTDPAETQIANGEIKFILNGTRLQGRYVLVKLRHSQRKNEWLFIRKPASTQIAPAPVVPAAPAASVPRSRKSSAVFNPATLPGARRAPMPSSITVALATLEEKPFSDNAWLFEIKWDGARAVVWAQDNEVIVRSRSHRDITREYPELRDFARRLSAREAIVDGEVVALDETGRSDFKKIQQRFGVINPSPSLLSSIPVVYYAFDILYCDGYDLRSVPLIERKNLLQRLLQPTDTIRYSDHQIGKGIELFEIAKQRGLEGLIAKRIDSEYTAGRSRLWIKIKIVHDLDVVIAGWTAPRRTRDHFGALLMGLYRGKDPHFVGSVGTGFDSELLAEIHARLEKFVVHKSPFKDPPSLKEKITWVEPKLVARVKYGDWTSEQRLRQPVFLGLLEDRDPSTCTFAEERTTEAPTVTAPSSKAPARAKSKAREASGQTRSGQEESPKPNLVRIPSARPEAIEDESALEKELANGESESLSAILNGHELSFTHLNKIYFPEAGYKKRQVLLHYLRVAKYLLPFLKDRPLVLKRYPNGIHGKFFFQKEAPESRPHWMRTVSIHSNERGGEMEYFVADDLAALLYLTNLGCIDHNPWSSRAQSQDRPDYVFFDFDPTEHAVFDSVVELARAAEQKLKSLGMRSYLKTSGATGFHIYVPLEPNYSYEQVQLFAAAVAEMVRREHADIVTLERSVQKRKKGTVLIDTLQNAHGKPLASVYSIRPVESASVSTPISPRELTNKLRADSWNIETIAARLRQRGDIWADFWKHPQRLEEAVSRADGG